MRIFGREPALIIGTIGTVLTALAGLKLDFLNAGQATAIVAFLTACLIAATTKPFAPALATGVLTAFVALLLEYGTHVPENIVATVTSILLAGFTFFGIRPQVTPSSDPRPEPTVVI